MNTEETIAGRLGETKLLFELNIPGKNIGFNKTKLKYNPPFCKKVGFGGKKWKKNSSLF